jgi:hypothetical protein
MYKIVYTSDFTEMTVSTDDFAKMLQETYAAGYNQKYELTDDIGKAKVAQMIEGARRLYLEQRLEALTEKFDKLSDSLNSLTEKNPKPKSSKK